MWIGNRAHVPNFAGCFVNGKFQLWKKILGAINFKSKNGTFVSLMKFSLFLLSLVNDLSFINSINGTENFQEHTCYCSINPFEKNLLLNYNILITQPLTVYCSITDVYGFLLRLMILLTVVYTEDGILKTSKHVQYFLSLF